MAQKYTQRHYQHLAAVFSYTKPSPQAYRTGAEYRARMEQWDSMLETIEDELRKDSARNNGKFDQGRFSNAAQSRDYWKGRI